MVLSINQSTKNSRATITAAEPRALKSTPRLVSPPTAKRTMDKTKKIKLVNNFPEGKAN